MLSRINAIFQYLTKASISVSFALSGDANYVKHIYLNFEIADFRLSRLSCIYCAYRKEEIHADIMTPNHLKLSTIPTSEVVHFFYC